jgi:hypothetical protein
MTDPAQKLAPADPRDLADAFAFALLFEGRKRARNARRDKGYSNISFIHQRAAAHSGVAAAGGSS